MEEEEIIKAHVLNMKYMSTNELKRKLEEKGVELIRLPEKRGAPNKWAEGIVILAGAETSLKQRIDRKDTWESELVNQGGEVLVGVRPKIKIFFYRMLNTGGSC